MTEARKTLLDLNTGPEAEARKLATQIEGARLTAICREQGHQWVGRNDPFCDRCGAEYN